MIFFITVLISVISVCLILLQLSSPAVAHPPLGIIVMALVIINVSKLIVLRLQETFNFCSEFHAMFAGKYSVVIAKASVDCCTTLVCS